MSVLSDIWAVFWPRLNQITQKERFEDNAQKKSDIEAIEGGDWGEESDLAISEAHRILAREDDRRRTAESKAHNLLLFLAALTPLLIYFASFWLEEDLHSVFIFLGAVLLLTAVVYAGCATFWSFRALKVAAYHEVYSVDLVKVWAYSKLIKKRLPIKLLTASRKNQDTVNRKVACIKMAYEFVVRAIYAIALIVVAQVSFLIFKVVA